MWKWAFAILYFVVAYITYRFFSEIWDKLLNNYPIPEDVKYTEKQFHAVCNLIYIGCMILWPIFFIYVFSPGRQKKRTKEK